MQAAPLVDVQTLESLSLKLDDGTKTYDACIAASNLLRLFTINRGLRQYPRSLLVQDFYVPPRLETDDDSMLFQLSRTDTIPRLLAVMPRLQSLHLKAILLADIPFHSASVTKLTLTNCHIAERCFPQLIAAFPRLQNLTLRGVTLYIIYTFDNGKEDTDTERIHLPGSVAYDLWLTANQGRNIRRDFPAHVTQGLSLKTLDVSLSTVGDFFLWDYLATSGAVADVLHLTVRTTVLGETMQERIQMMVDKTRMSVDIRGLMCTSDFPRLMRCSLC